MGAGVLLPVSLRAELHPVVSPCITPGPCVTVAAPQADRQTYRQLLQANHQWLRNKNVTYQVNKQPWQPLVFLALLSRAANCFYQCHGVATAALQFWGLGIEPLNLESGAGFILSPLLFYFAGVTLMRWPWFRRSPKEVSEGWWMVKGVYMTFVVVVSMVVSNHWISDLDI